MKAIESAFLLKIGRYFSPSPSEIAALQKIVIENNKYMARVELIEYYENYESVFILNEGWGYSFKDLSNGQRQVIDFILPGDIFGLQGIFLNGAGLGFASITPVDAATVSPQSLLAMSARWPRLGGAILWSASLQGSIAAERLVALGRRSAAGRMAHLLLELSVRLELIGQGNSAGFFCPLTQHDLANALGLTSVHVNRVLRHLRQLGLVVFRNSEVEFLNRQGLIDIAHFDAAYLGRGREASRKIFGN
ncbi:MULTISPECIES: Crp/Fnr family transcriptional regulator [Inquilinus]|uniref:CRP-like cAMP-binding protein n=1 Tax=Inquilinus ginsengisoli TaxID=363840 RepID=A0ABU1JI19_9PROT|nr:Crp/Fnr family transcriptional regulator [Inquilinus ginsengisoli]MDR6288258.1 CRP-like cAMP-binding protein [Inquilinus ginsengisoli]